MQLGMAAPLDIGLEQNDPSLQMGQDDMFDLENVEREMRKKGGISRLTIDENIPEDQDEEEWRVEEEEDEGEALDSDEEKEKKISGLEAELDGMYDAYQEKLKERDAKYRVKEARKKNGLLEEWAGIKADSDEDSDESCVEGGWDKMEEAKGLDTESFSEDNDEEQTIGQKRTQEPAGPVHKRARFSIAPSERPAPFSHAAGLWFSQEVFKEMDDLTMEPEDGDVDMVCNPTTSQRQSEEDEVIALSRFYTPLLIVCRQEMISTYLYMIRNSKIWKCGIPTALTRTMLKGFTSKVSFLACLIAS